MCDAVAATDAEDPYAAFEARVSATFAKLKSATERNTARSMVDAGDDGAGEAGYGARGYQASSDYYNGTSSTYSSSYSSGATTTFDWGADEEEEEEEEDGDDD